MNFKRTRLIALMLLLCTAVLMFSSCTGEKVDKPEDTNLEYWIGDTLNTDESTLLGTFDVSEHYLDSKYEPIIDAEGGFSKPEHCVVYYYSNYPLLDLGISKRISAIIITDPEVNVWGLTINSTKEEIRNALEENGFIVSFSGNRIIGDLGRYTIIAIVGESISINYETPSIIAALWSIDLD